MNKNSKISSVKIYNSNESDSDDIIEYSATLININNILPFADSKYKYAAQVANKYIRNKQIDPSDISYITVLNVYNDIINSGKEIRIKPISPLEIQYEIDSLGWELGYSKISSFTHCQFNEELSLYFSGNDKNVYYEWSDGDIEYNNKLGDLYHVTESHIKTFRSFINESKYNKSYKNFK